MFCGPRKEEEGPRKIGPFSEANRLIPEGEGGPKKLFLLFGHKMKSKFNAKIVCNLTGRESNYDTNFVGVSPRAVIK